LTHGTLNLRRREDSKRVNQSGERGLVTPGSNRRQGARGRRGAIHGGKKGESQDRKNVGKGGGQLKKKKGGNNGEKGGQAQVPDKNKKQRASGASKEKGEKARVADPIRRRSEKNWGAARTLEKKNTPRVRGEVPLGKRRKRHPPREGRGRSTKDDRVPLGVVGPSSVKVKGERWGSKGKGPKGRGEGSPSTRRDTVREGLNGSFLERCMKREGGGKRNHGRKRV